VVRPYLESDHSAVVELVLGIQNDEFHLGISLSEQPDLDNINASYCDKNGAFWVAEEGGVVVGCIGLMALSPKVGVLKKFFLKPAFRGSDKNISAALFSTLRSFAALHGLDAILLDTPSAATRSHAFYKRVGFRPISKQELPVPYEYPDRDSLLFILELGKASSGTGPEVGEGF
jgi:N-acetylglutamate synthase-like GNAT family acetyltransferase